MVQNGTVGVGALSVGTPSVGIAVAVHAIAGWFASTGAPIDGAVTDPPQAGVVAEEPPEG